MDLLLFLLTLAALIGLWAWLRWRSLIRALNEYAQNLRLAASEEAARLPQPAHASLQNVADAVEHLQRRSQESALVWQTGQIRLAALLQQMTDGVLTVTRQGKIDFANPAAASILGQASLEGRSIVEALRDHRLVNLWKTCLQTGEPQTDSLEIPLRRQSLQVTVLADTQHPGGALLLMHDLTPLRRLETVRRDFISNLSHELRTPLASLKALAETLRDGALQDPQAAPQFLARIETEVEALNQMSSELLDLSRIESGQLALQLSSFRPAVLLQSAAERMKAQVERAGLALNVHLEPDLPILQADFQRLEQVLVNLIHNAIKFTPAGGEISLSARALPPHIEFSVQDSGIGIPAEEQARIFERFYRVDRARTRSGGSGLGLAICRHLVQAHGGQLGVESRPGQGSRFFFTV